MEFDLGKGINVNLALMGNNRAWLAEKLNKPRCEITRIGHQNWTSGEVMVQIASAFNMGLSEFIASCEFNID